MNSNVSISKRQYQFEKSIEGIPLLSVSKSLGTKLFQL